MLRVVILLISNFQCISTRPKQMRDQHENESHTHLEFT